MMFLRSFARPVLLAWLLVFALILAGPASVSARVEMLNGRDGVEGDPDDGVGAIGGGGSGDGSNNNTLNTPLPINVRTPVFAEFLIVYVPGQSFVIIVKAPFEIANKNRGGGE